MHWFIQLSRKIKINYNHKNDYNHKYVILLWGVLTAIYWVRKCNNSDTEFITHPLTILFYLKSNHIIWNQLTLFEYTTMLNRLHMQAGNISIDNAVLVPVANTSSEREREREREIATSSPTFILPSQVILFCYQCFLALSLHQHFPNN